MGNLKTPEINIEEIQEAANAAAKKAYLNAIADYYTSYSSPYKKLIEAELEKQKFKYNMELPNIMAEINESLSNEVDSIANQAIATSFIPMISKALIGLDKEMKLSELLKMIIEELEPDSDNYEEFHFSYKEEREYGWIECELTTHLNNYAFTLHTLSRSKQQEGKYQLLSMPYNKYKKGYNSNMTIYKDDIKIEMPFTPGILEDEVLNIFFKMMLSNTIIELDCEGFDDDMFPEDEHCHC